MKQNEALKALQDMRANFEERLKVARASNDAYMMLLFGRRVEALKVAIKELKRNAK